ncbi:MAG: 5-(carboxyamino)imidazole ribonucleotide synthase [Cytophagaceae bacterium]|nr:5-(carboxyamino)imidazole ribonucleotide synthase [Cytophagaceae bacterium]
MFNHLNIGLLGGGQLGRMLIQAAVDLDLNIAVLDPDKEAPCSSLVKEFIVGSLTDYDSVYQFGKGRDLITIEIENVNIQALKQLEKEGVKVFPQPDQIELIQDKRVQKQFYKERSIPTADFVLINSKSELIQHSGFLPAFQKLGKSGYDGRGVQRLTVASDFEKGFEGESLLEKLVDYQKELSVIVARNTVGEIKAFPVVELVFHPVHNLVEYLFSPAELRPEIQKAATDLALRVINELELTGVLAVEMFLTHQGEVLVNEIAPRPHNSGHQTIEANFTSQYEQHWRAILGMPLGSTTQLMPAAMVNLLGEEGFNGPSHYDGIEEVMALEGVYPHLYGKKITKPFRKMGHITVLDKNLESLKSKVKTVKERVKVIAKQPKKISI